MAGADPYIRDKDNNTPLMSGHYWEPIAKLFLIYGIALSQEDIAQLVRRSLEDSDRWRTGSPQLVITLWRTSIAEPLNEMHNLPSDVVQLLLEFTTTSDIPNTEVQAWVNVFQAIEIGDLETVQGIVKDFPKVHRATDKEGRDLFTAATRHRQVAVMAFLILNGYYDRVNDVFDSMSGIGWAAHHGHLDVAQFFLRQTDADIEGQRHTTTPPYPTPLVRAARMNQLEMVKLFLEFGIRLFPEDLTELKALCARTNRLFSPREIIENMRKTLMDHFPEVEQALLGVEYEPRLHFPTDVRRLIVSILATPRLAENGDLLQTKAR